MFKGEFDNRDIQHEKARVWQPPQRQPTLLPNTCFFACVVPQFEYNIDVLGFWLNHQDIRVISCN